MNSNFDFLQSEFPVLATFGCQAEKYCFSDPNSCLMKLGMIGESIVNLMFTYDRIQLPYDNTAVTRIDTLQREGLLTRDLTDILHALRKARNKAVHENYDSESECKILIQMAHSLCEWFMQTYGDWNYQHHDFVMPELENKRVSVPQEEKAAEERQAEELTKQAEQKASIAEAISKSERQKQAGKMASQRPKSEAETRYIIDEQLRQVGWEADTENLRYSKGTRPAKGHNMAIAEWPTNSTVGQSGRVDYALFVDTKLIGVIEAKAIHKDIPSVIDYQGKEYPRNIRKEDSEYQIGEWGEYKVPFTFATNGRPYLKQLETKSGIWFLDLRSPANNPTALHGWISPMGMVELLEKNPQEGNSALKALPYDFLTDPKGLNLREYQLNAIKAAEQSVIEGKKNILLAMATGTGKTRTVLGMIYRFLKTNRFKRILFLVDRTSLGEQASDVFKEVKLEDLMTLDEIYNVKGFEDKNIDKETRIQVATVQSMVKRILYNDGETMPAVTDYDLVIIDEAHRIGAKSYQEIMDYFKPKFWLGMSASPERTDDFDVYAAFDHNIAYEIRLQQALEENLLCPFHYFGITDFLTDGNETDFTDFNYLTSNQRVDYIIKQTNYYGYSGERVKGLMFCSSKKEAAALSERLNLRGYRTLALSGEDSQEKREDVIDRLVSDTRSDYLQYILTVDIFNEGVDIPEINQVVLLRPTQSPIVFVQQLGRGLRKSQDKEYVVILDFIGNYKNNFMIPIALSGDRSYNKDNIRRYVLEGERIIPGSSTIHFDEISKKQIFASIDTANFADIKLIKDSYKNLKNKLGRIPTLMDFETYGEIDVQRIFDNKSLGSYYAFLKKYEKDYKVRLNELEESFIKFICTKLANGKRKIELEILNDLIDDKDYIFPNDISQTNVFNIFTNEFPTGSGKNTFKDCIFIEDTKISKPFKTCLENDEFKSMVKEIIEYALDQYNKHYKNTYKDTNFVLYQKYTYEDACRLLNWQHNEVPLNIGGYKYDQTTKTFPVFINYDKANDIQDTIKYEDHFINESQLIAISKSGRTTSSDDVQNFLYAKERGIEVHLFVRKNKDDKTSKEFYYLGHMQAEIDNTKQFVMPNTQKTAVEILWQLDTPVREDIYRYIVEE